MDSQSRAFESPVESNPVVAAAPLTCPRAMHPQTLTIWTPFSILGSVVMALLTLPRTLVLAPAASRRRRA